MIIHLFNSSSVSGPERLVMPALASVRQPVLVINLLEERIKHLRGSDPLGEYAKSLNIMYRDVRVRGRWDFQACRSLQELLKHLRPDLVHAHDVKASTYLLWACPKKGPSRYSIVSTHHGVHGRPDWKTRLYERLYRKCILRSFDRVLCVSNSDYKFLLRSGVDRNRLRLHLNGINGRWVDHKNRFHEAQGIRLRWLPQETGRDALFLFGAIGRLSPEKDHGRLLNVLAHLNQMACDRNWKCLIFGTGPLEKTLRERAHRLGLEDRVLWMGYHQNLANDLAGLNLLLSFSKAEGLPINLIEAGWAGTPILCTRVGGIADLIPDERYGQWILPGESTQQSAGRLKECLSDKGEARLLDQGLLFQKLVVEKFTQTQWIEHLEEIYSELNASFLPLKKDIRTSVPRFVT